MNKKYRYIITTSQPSLIYYFYQNNKWKLKRTGHTKLHKGFKRAKIMKGSEMRYTTSWEFLGE